jgi:hypothetical protein
LLGAWFGLGILGFLAVVAAVSTGVAVGWQLGTGTRTSLAAGVVGSLCAAFVLLNANPVLYARYCWMPLALAVPLARLGDVTSWIPRMRYRPAEDVVRHRQAAHLPLTRSLRIALSIAATCGVIAALVAAGAYAFTAVNRTTTTTVTAAIPASKRDAADAKSSRPAAAMVARIWAYRSCGAGCRITSLAHLFGSFWEMRVEYASPRARACFALDLSEFRATAAGYRGIDRLSCSTVR